MESQCNLILPNSLSLLSLFMPSKRASSPKEYHSSKGIVLEVQVPGKLQHQDFLTLGTLSLLLQCYFADQKHQKGGTQETPSRWLAHPKIRWSAREKQCIKYSAKRSQCQESISLGILSILVFMSWGHLYPFEATKGGAKTL